MNNLVEVLQALKELNFMLANKAPELAAHYNMMLEPCQISAEEVPDFVKAHLHHATAYNPEHSIRGRPLSNIIGTIDNHLHYQGTINKHIGQMHIFILILIEITLILITTIIANVILFIPLNILIIQVTVKLML